MKSSFDPGLSQKFSGNIRRVINKDGSFNVQRRGKGFKQFHLYQWLIGISWPKYIGLVFLTYFTMNSIFGFGYYLIGVDQLAGVNETTEFGKYLSCLFFSFQTLTTVGYGNMAPIGHASNVLAGIEAITGVMGFAVGTGLLYGRFSRPSAKLMYSEKAVIAPYQEKTALMFRVANMRLNMLLELEALVLLMVVENASGTPKANYTRLTLEREKISFLPISWTVVHPIDEQSPLWGKTPEDLAKQHTEIIIQIKVFDETFSQHVHSRYSYRVNEMAWGEKFIPAFYVDQHGDVIVELEKIGMTEKA